MTTVHEAMCTNPPFVLAGDTLLLAARKLRESGLHALPAIGPGGELQGTLTSHDIVVGCIANGGNPDHAVVCEYLREADVVRAGEPLDAALRTMAELRLDRLPVVDERGRFVGILTHDAALATLSTAGASSPPDGHRGRTGADNAAVRA